jgi:hypothetical protein
MEIQEHIKTLEQDMYKLPEDWDYVSELANLNKLAGKAKLEKRELINRKNKLDRYIELLESRMELCQIEQAKKTDIYYSSLKTNSL